MKKTLQPKMLSVVRSASMSVLQKIEACSNKFVRPKLTEIDFLFSCFYACWYLLCLFNTIKNGGKLYGNKTGRVMMEHLDEPLILIAQLCCCDYKLQNYVAIDQRKQQHHRQRLTCLRCKVWDIRQWLVGIFLRRFPTYLPTHWPTCLPTFKVTFLPFFGHNPISRR
jgi:hypothetical protein